MKLKALHHVRFAVKNLSQQETFAQDFGLVTHSVSDTGLVMKTHGGDLVSYIAVKGEADAFLGFAFEVFSDADLTDAIEHHGAIELQNGQIPFVDRAVKLVDPDGNDVILVSGVERVAPHSANEDLVINTPFNKKRIGVSQQKRAVGPAVTWRLGHIGLFVSDFKQSAQWYTEKFGLIGSDIYHVPNMPEFFVVGFFRFNQGEEYVDHHCLALMQDERRNQCHHISFETQDFESQQCTHRFLSQQNYESIWGVGRHPHGSHVFDVWRSPDGNRFETFSDTDLFNNSFETNYHDISKQDLDAWSNDGPEKYFI